MKAAVIYAALALDQCPAQQPAIVIAVVTEPDDTGQRVDAVERLARVVVAAVQIGDGGLAVKAVRGTQTVEVDAAFQLGAFEGGVPDVVGLEREFAVPGCDGVLVDEIAVLVVEHRNVERA